MPSGSRLQLASCCAVTLASTYTTALSVTPPLYVNDQAVIYIWCSVSRCLFRTVGLVFGYECSTSCLWKGSPLSGFGILSAGFYFWIYIIWHVWRGAAIGSVCVCVCVCLCVCVCVLVSNVFTSRSIMREYAWNWTFFISTLFNS